MDPYPGCSCLKVFCLHSFLVLTPIAPLEPVVASHVPCTMEARKKYCDILLWKMKVELADLKVREMALVHTIAELEQEAAAAEIVRGSDGPESEASKTLSHGRGTSSITIFVDVNESEESRTLSRRPGISGDGDCREGSEETRTLSHGRDMSEASDKQETSKYRVVACRTITNI